MAWRVRERFSDAGRAVNEDSCGTAGSLAWICDGAGALGPARYPGTGTDAAWLVQAIDTNLAAYAADTGAPDVARVSLRLQLDLAAAYGAPSDHDPAGGPTCCLAVVAMTGLSRGQSTCDVGILGDVVVLTRMGGGHVVALTDERVKPFEALSLAALGTSPRPEGMMPPAARAQVQANRAKMNTAAGFPLVCPRAAWAGSLVHFGLSLQPGQPLVLMSDGFYRLVDVFERYDNDDLYAACAAGHGAALLAELRALERDDADMSVYRRFKTHDDATLLVVSADED
jgi:Protein phosphatase 2C